MAAQQFDGANAAAQAGISPPLPPSPPSVPSIPPPPTPPSADAPRSDWETYARQMEQYAQDVAKAATQKLKLRLNANTSGESGTRTGTVDSRGSRREKSSDRSNHSDNLPIIAIVFVFLYLIVRAIMAPFSRKNRAPAAAPAGGGGGGFSHDELALLHKMQRTLSQMETRVEALETILIEQQNSQRSRRMAGTSARGDAPSSGTLRSNPNI